MTQEHQNGSPEVISTITDAQKIAVFHEMARAWSAKEWRTCANLFTPNGVLHSVMIDPVVGRETIYQRIVKLEAPNKEVNLRIHRIGVIDGALFVERSDEIILSGTSRSAPVVGVLQFEGDKISLWREYYDRAQLMRAAGHAPVPAVHG